ncbi:hypothetical protein DFJ74DRAFT_662896 [Hyaloraphidium curvatum]|nr:hypothetical protein DFJ74DRAFT_662896 [Hyaloraphidium curvatum]
MSMPAFGSLLDQSLREGFLEVAADMESLPSDQRAAKVVIGEEHKRLALAMCGWGSPHPGSSSGDNGVDEELEDALHTMELGGHYEKAAGWALFRGASLGRAIKCLRSSNEERLKLVAVALSAALPTGTNPTTDSAGILARGGFPAVFVDLCSSLATDLQDPYLRAMFALVANGGDWHVVLDEKELPLRDRVGVAVRFLSDDQLLSYIKRTRGVMIQSGSIEGILLTGLLSADGQGSTRAKDGIQLLQNHVDRTGDAQTAALCTAMVYPGRVQDRRTDEWVDAYRSLLDRWEMFHERARFDIARGRYANFASWSAKSSVPGTPTLTQVSPRGLSVPPQIAVRCNFCGSGIQHRVATGRKDFKAIACPTCRKPLPRCSLCLMPMGTWPTSLDTVPGGATAGAGLLSAAASPANSPPKTPIAIVSTASRSSIKKAPLDPTSMGPGPTVPSGFDAWFTWCVRCRHGGHNVHVREWFAEHSVCPVTGCGCRCSAL